MLLVGKGLFDIVPTVTIITKSTQSIYSLLKSINPVANGANKYKQCDFLKFIDNSDIICKLSIYTKILNEFPGTCSKAIKKSLIYVKDIIINIESEIFNIKTKIDYNKSIWFFGNVRSYNINDEINNIQSLFDKLDKRISLLQTTIEISKLWNNDVFKENNLDNDLNNDSDFDDRIDNDSGFELIKFKKI
jgi:hypothetical protein